MIGFEINCVEVGDVVIDDVESVVVGVEVIKINIEGFLNIYGVIFSWGFFF